MNGLYKDLYERVIAAQDELLKENVRANTVVINGKKYGKLSAEVQVAWFNGYVPMLFGLAVESASLPDDFDFVVQARMTAPVGKVDRLEQENKMLKEKLRKIRAAIGDLWED